MDIVRIIPEEHRWDKNFETRVDYVEECKSYANRILADLEKQKALLDPEKDRLFVIYMGDINHRDFSDLESFLYWLQYFIRLNEICDGNVYSLIGNHEITYSHNNLFWMISDIQSDWAKERLKHLNASGMLKPLIKVVDELVLNDTMFIMGHYGRDLSEYTESSISPEIKNVILLTHNQIMNSTVIRHFRENMHRDMSPEHIRYTSLEKEGILPRTERLRRVYVGHMHKAYGQFHFVSDIDGVNYDVVLDYLASIGRTNVTEIAEDFCERNIPNITCDIICLYCYCIIFTLVSRGVVVNEATLTRNRETYGSAKAIRELRETHIVMRDPVTDIRSKLGKGTVDSYIFESALTGSMPDDLIQNLDNVNNLLNKYNISGVVKYGR